MKVLVEQGTYEGFTVIAEAREYLLRLGKKEIASAQSAEAAPDADVEQLGCHVVAPVRGLIFTPLRRKSNSTKSTVPARWGLPNPPSHQI